MYNKIVKEINKIGDKISKLTDEQLKNKTHEFKERLKSGAEIEDIIIEAFAVAKEATKRITGKTLYDVQLCGGYVINQGRIAEIKAGEGKTLTAVLPAYVNSLKQEGVHIVTTNDYLAQRDFNEIGPILESLDVSVGIINQNMNYKEKKKAYNKDVTYGTNTEFGFDYLRDNLVKSKDEIVQRKLNCVIIDEADSILIDEAQTPMIISRKIEEVDNEKYNKAKMFVESLKGIHILKEKPKNRKQIQQIEKYDYYVDDTYKTVNLTQNGIKKAEAEYNLKNFYEETNIETINLVEQALKAKEIFKKDIDYIVNDGKAILIDKYTGRIMYGKRYTKGLHEAIEAKENLKIEESSVMLANITTQNYFKMYNKMSGMTGTAKSAEKELNDIYQIDVVKIPTNKPSKRIDHKDKIYKTKEEKYNAIINDIKETHKKGQPVLIGTTSIESSEKISDILKKENIEHQLLNAKNHELEAEIVKEAGKFGKVTIATNMAGRGTNILLDDESKKIGGLKIIGTEKNESARIDEQLRGRSGRQGEVGESIFYISKQDDLFRIYGSQKKAENMDYTIRKRLLYYDETLNYQRKIIHKNRKQILNKNIESKIKEFIELFCEELITTQNPKINEYKKELEEKEKIEISKENIEELKSKIIKRYESKIEEVGQDIFFEHQKNRILNVIDECWIEQLEIMEDLKNNIELRIYGGHNPIEEFKIEGKKYFDQMNKKIKMNIVTKLLFNSDY